MDQAKSVRIARDSPKSNDTTIVVNSGHENVVTNVDLINHKLTVADGTTVSQLKAAITVKDNGTFKVYTGTTEANDADPVTATMIVKVTAENGTTENYTIEIQ